MNKIKNITPVLFSLGIVFLFYIKRFTLLKFYPPICNFFMFMVFFISLFTKETVIQKIAKVCNSGTIKESEMQYTRNLTYVWCIFIFLNFVISVWTIFLPDKIWIIYNGFISYFLVGMLFIIEYIVRIILRKRKVI